MFGYRNCTDFVAYKLGLTWGKPFKGDGGDWNRYVGPGTGWIATHSPHVGDIAQWISKDHVGIVTAVHRGTKTTVDIEDYNGGVHTGFGTYGTQKGVVADWYLHRGSTKRQAETISAPAGISVRHVSRAEIAFLWHPVRGAAGYVVYLNGSRLAATGADSPGYTFAGLSCGRRYTFGFQASGSHGAKSSVATKAASTSACPPTTTTNQAAGAAPPGSRGVYGLGIQANGHPTVTSATLGGTATTTSAGDTLTCAAPSFSAKGTYIVYYWWYRSIFDPGSGWHGAYVGDKASGQRYAPTGPDIPSEDDPGHAVALRCVVEAELTDGSGWTYTYSAPIAVRP
ncbi:MAG TPA: CHAP domain-containing protein [Gaiellaceae bacterium]|nr:CHAP domain-containing protein [Gaiellaceae bacterium]